MSKCLIIADLHLGHRRIIEYEPARSHFPSIAEHDAEIERRWRETVHPHDVVYVLGDVAWNRAALDRMVNWPGIKKLVMGNHDRHDMRAYLAIFRKVTAYAEVAGWLLAHMPVVPWSIASRYQGQIHGHVHGARPLRYAVDVSRDGKLLRPAMYINASAEMIGFRPRTIEWLARNTYFPLTGEVV